MKSKIVSFNLDKRGISIMIGYILLITSAIAMSAIVYQWMKGYVPKDAIDCPEGVSLFITKLNCTDDLAGNYDVKLTLRNNGRFDVGGYFVHATDSAEQTLATLDLTENLITGGNVENKAVFFKPLTEGTENEFKPDDPERLSTFSVPEKIYSVEILPFRWQVEENKKRLVSCGNAKIFEKVTCKLPNGEDAPDAPVVPDEPPVDCDPACIDPEVCELGSCVAPEACVPSCSGDCGDDGCGGSCGTCTGNDICDENVGLCVPKCQNPNQCDVGAGEVCVSGVCQLCGNGIIDGVEECDSVAGCGADCIALGGYSCINNVCSPN